LGKLVHDVDGLFVRDLRAAVDQVALPLREPFLAVGAEILADDEVAALVLLGSHVGWIVAQGRRDSNRFVAVCLPRPPGLRPMVGLKRLIPILLLTAGCASGPAPLPELRNIRQLTTDGTHAEAYFSYDGKKLVLMAQ